MRVKRRRLSLVLLVCSMLAGACGGGPDAQPADLDEVRARVSGLTREGKANEALAEAEAFLKRHPGKAHAHLLMTEAVGQMAETTSDPERTTFLERTAMHHERVVELTKDSTLRTFSLGALIAYQAPKYLNRPDRAETYARRIITEAPGEAVSYVYLVDLFKSAGRFDDAAQVLIDARKTIANDEPYQQAHLGDLMVDLADARHGAPLDTRRRLLVQAQAVADEGLKAQQTADEAQAFRRLKSQAIGLLALLERDPGK